jgi:hypothetical protein
MAARVARFRIVGRLDTGRPQEGTVTITRDSLLLSVRPLRRRREYVLPLAAVAEIIVARVLKAELAERVARKVARRRGR